MRVTERVAEWLGPESIAGATFRVLITTYEDWRDGRVIRLGGALAYYGLFSLASVLALALSLSHALLGRDQVQDFIGEQLQDLLGDSISPEASVTLNDLLANSTSSLGLVGLVGLFITGSLVFLALEDALNYIWGIPVRVGIRFTIKRRVLAAFVMFSAAALIVLSIVVQAVTALLGDLVPQSLPLVDVLETILASLLSWATLIIAIVLLFRYFPATPVSWRASIVGGSITSGVMVIGTSLIGWYLRTYGASSISGAASSVLLILVWIFYEAQMLLAGAQLTKTLSDRWAPVIVEPDANNA